MKPFHATVAGLVAIGGLLIAHLAMANQGGGYTGVLLILDQLFAVGLVLGMFAIAAGVGGRLLKAGGLRLEPLEALLFGTTAGLGTLATAIFAVGWLSVRPVVLLAVLVGAAFIGRNELRELPLLVKDVLPCQSAQPVRLRGDRARRDHGRAHTADGLGRPHVSPAGPATVSRARFDLPDGGSCALGVRPPA